MLANFDDHPEEMTRTLTSIITNPLPLGVKRAMIAEMDTGKPESE